MPVRATARGRETQHCEDPLQLCMRRTFDYLPPVPDPALFLPTASPHLFRRSRLLDLLDQRGASQRSWAIPFINRGRIRGHRRRDIDRHRQRHRFDQSSRVRNGGHEGAPRKAGSVASHLPKGGEVVFGEERSDSCINWFSHVWHAGTRSSLHTLCHCSCGLVCADQAAFPVRQ